MSTHNGTDKKSEKLTTMNSHSSRLPSLSWSASSQMVLSVSTGSFESFNKPTTLFPGRTPLSGWSELNSVWYFWRSSGLIDQSVAATGIIFGGGGGFIFGTSPHFGAFVSIRRFFTLMFSPNCASETSFRATKNPVLSRHPRPFGSDKSQTYNKRTIVK